MTKINFSPVPGAGIFPDQTDVTPLREKRSCRSGKAADAALVIEKACSKPFAPNWRRPRPGLDNAPLPVGVLELGQFEEGDAGREARADPTANPHRDKHNPVASANQTGLSAHAAAGPD